MSSSSSSSNLTSTGKVITFYSYKGGTGRSMALANVAWILASNGKRVLVVDWDLEAPGLHRYFRPFLLDPGLTSSEGIIDMVLEFALEAITPVDEGQERPPDWYLPYANILRYANSLQWSFPAQGRLDFIPAGKQTFAYASRMNSFDWRNFYERLGGGAFLDTVIDGMKKEYDYILIDSRTGVSDTSGICTIKMPDALVVCFTLNNQGIEGAASVAESVAAQRGSSSLPIYPVAMRIEHAEKTKLELRKKYAKELFSNYPAHFTVEQREQYFEEVKIPYVPFYAYEEVLACFGDMPGAIDTVLATMERLTSYLTGGAVRQWVTPTDEERKNILRQYAGQTAPEVDDSRVVVIAPQGAEIYIDDERYGSIGRSGRLILNSIMQGRHVLRIARAGEIDDERVIEINPEEGEQVIQAQLKTFTPFLSRSSQTSSAVSDGTSGHPPGSVRCMSCGNIFEAGTKFCGRCGGTLFAPAGDNAGSAAPAETPKDKSRTIPAAPSTYTPPLSVVETVFLSYAHADESLASEMVNHLALLNRGGIINDWYERKVEAEPTEEIDQHLDSARIILFLVSPAFLTSDYCYGSEVKRALERHERAEAYVIPIILRPVDWHAAPFRKLQALPSDGRPVALWPNRDEAFLDIAQGIRGVVEQLTTGEITARAVSETASLHIPRPPITGYIKRRDTDGNDIVERLKKELAPDSNQFIALWGRGGVGKTTLAAAAARALLDAYNQRIVWINTESRRDMNFQLLLDEIAAQLGRADLRPLNPEHKEEQVRVLVSSAPTLIIIDNFEVLPMEEQVKCAVFLGQSILCSALITSRQKVSVARTITIDSMSMQEARSFLDTLIEQTLDPQAFAKVDRERLVQMAEGIPFVLQWIVAQIDLAQEPETVLKELEQGTSDAVQRAFDRSFNLPQVGVDGRATLLALSLFLPSASRKALAEVAGFDDDMSRLNIAIRNLRALRLIGVTEGNERLTLAGLTRNLVRARLSTDPQAESFRQRFLRYFSSYATEHNFRTPEDYDALEAEKDNVLNSMDIAFETEQWKDVVAIYVGFGDFLYVRGYWDDAIQRGEHVLQAIEAAQQVDSLFSIIPLANYVATIYKRRGHLEKARDLYHRSLKIAQSLGDELGVASTLNELGTLAYIQGELDEARRLYNESLEIKKKLGDQTGIAATLHGLGNIAYIQCEGAEARALYQESLKIAENLGNQLAVAANLYKLGRLAVEEDDFAQANQLYGESLKINTRLGNQSGIATSLYALGINAHNQGNSEEAKRLYTESLEISRKLDDKECTAKALHQLGRIAGDDGDKAQAVENFRAALSIFEQLNSPNAEITQELLSEIRDESAQVSSEILKVSG